MKIIGSSENIIDVANKYGLDLSNFKDFLLKKCIKNQDYEKSFGAIIIDSVREKELVEKFSPGATTQNEELFDEFSSGIVNQKKDYNNELSNGLYKIVPGPMMVDVGDGATKKAFAKFSNIINSNAVDGWRYHSMEELTVEQNNGGCLSNDVSRTKYYMLIFEKTSCDGKNN